MKKTYYSVVYRTWGADSESYAWFDNQAEAQNFAKKDYTGAIVTHNVSKPETIKEYDKLVKDTIYNLNF